LKAYELKFWAEFFDEEGEDNVTFWMKLVGLYEPQCIRVIRALGSRKKGNPVLWASISGDEPPVPPYCHDGIFYTNDLGGLMMWFG
jgi:hypothetical protein